MPHDPHDPHDPYPPLITSRSPSYERAREERKHPSPTTDPTLIAALARRYELEEDARRAYLAALALTQATDELALRFESRAGEHQARRDAFARRIEQLGGAPPRPEDCRALLHHGREAIERALDRDSTLAELEALEAELSAAGPAEP